MENFNIVNNKEQVEVLVVKTKKKPSTNKTYYIPIDIQKKIDWLSKNADNKNSSRLLCELVNLEYEKQNQHNKEHIENMEGVAGDNFILQTIALENQELKDKLDGLQKYIEEIVYPAIQNKNTEMETLNNEVAVLKTDIQKLGTSFVRNKQNHHCAMKNVGATFEALKQKIVHKWEVKETVNAEGVIKYETVKINEEETDGGNNDPTN